MRAILLSLLMAPVAVRAQDAEGLKEILSGDHIPLTVAVKDLDAEWRKVAVSMPESGGKERIYYTKGLTVSRGQETFLIAYSPPAAPKPNPGRPDLELSEPRLRLALLNLRGLSVLSVREFSFSEDAPHAVNADPGSASSTLSNLKQLALGTLMYCQDYDETLPPLKDMASVKPLIMPYLKNDLLFIDPQTGERFHVNRSLSKKKQAKIAEPASTVLFFQPRAVEGKRAVAFMDGHAKRIDESEWPKLKKASKILKE